MNTAGAHDSGWGVREVGGGRTGAAGVGAGNLRSLSGTVDLGSEIGNDEAIFKSPR
jgi:hypothetical protein